MYSNIDDCDEGASALAFLYHRFTVMFVVFNFWEPLHFLHRGAGFQTWELSPVYALRSWAYILLHLPPVRLASSLFGPDKVSIEYDISYETM
jgi:alpha-1,2-mannosyltransferase